MSCPSHRHSPFLLATLAMLAAGCGSEAPSAPDSLSNLNGAPTCRRGGYPTELTVSPDATPGDGIQFRRIGDALTAVRAGRLARGETEKAACRITITLAAGIFSGSTATDTATTGLEHFPIVIDVPDITLRGALSMRLDNRGRATGVSRNLETVIAPTAPLPFIASGPLSIPIIMANGHPGGSAGHNLTIEGLVFQSGHTTPATSGGQGILSVRVRGITIRGNRFESGFTESIDLRASTGEVLWNHLGGGAGTCDVCLAGPGVFLASGNTLLAGGIPGFLIVPTIGFPVPAEAEPFVLPVTAEVSALVLNNKVQDHLRLPVGAGIRVGALGAAAGTVPSSSRVAIIGNELVNNRFNMIFEAAFPVAAGPLKGDMTIDLGLNSMTQSCQNDVLVAFSRHTTVLGAAPQVQPYLRNSIYKFRLNGDFSWDDVWYGNPDGFGNQLYVNGRLQPNGARHFYSATGCPAQGT